jgi:methylated-DNA-[protein]-cysteine S-methyltransferase
MTTIHIFTTALGSCGIAWRDDRVCAIQLPGRHETEVREELSRRIHGELREVATPRGAHAKLVTRVQRHLDGTPDPFTDVELDLDGASEFSRQVYAEARRIPPGRTSTYGELADRCGQPGAARAVGRAMSHNPVPLVVPCHRVLAGDGELRGFSAPGGVQTKLRMLTVEGADQARLALPGPRVLCRSDPTLGAVIRRVGPYTLDEVPSTDPFTALTQSIVHQQVSMAAGRTIYGRLRDVLGGRVTPRRVAATTPDDLRSAGLSRQKSSYIVDLASRTLDGSLPLKRLERMDDERVVEVLTAVKGLGRWSAEMYLIFHLRRLDVLPVGDLGLRRGVARAYGLGENPAPDRIREIAAAWIPYRSIATWYLWRAQDSGGL